MMRTIFQATSNFAGHVAALLTLKPASHLGFRELELVSATDERAAVQYTARSYDTMVEMLLLSGSKEGLFRFEISEKDAYTTGFGLGSEMSKSPLVAVLWGAPEESFRLINALNARFAAELREWTISQSALTPRELEILSLVAEGKTSAEVASACAIAESTVNVHVKNCMKKTATKSRAHLIATAINAGYL